MEENETEEGLKMRAYSLGLKLKHSGLDADVIYARLEKQGIPENLARQVASDVMIERRKSEAKDEQSFYYLALVKIGVGVAAAIISAIILPDRIILPIGLIMGGVVYAVATKSK